MPPVDPPSYSLVPRHHEFTGRDEHRGLKDEYLAWCVVSSHVVTMTPTSTIPALHGLRKRFVKEGTCFANATRVLEQVPGATYVEGFLDNPLLRHAWNKVDGQYFDVTAERASPGGWHKAYHVLIADQFP
jgi:hypothetical protein